MQLCMRAGEWGRDGAGRASAREAATTFAHILNAQLHDFLVHRTGLIGQFYTWWRGGEASHGPRDPKAGGGWGDATRRGDIKAGALISSPPPTRAPHQQHSISVKLRACPALRYVRLTPPLSPAKPTRKREWGGEGSEEGPSRSTWRPGPSSGTSSASSSRWPIRPPVNHLLLIPLFLSRPYVWL
jgi:hypothetical protein